MSLWSYVLEEIGTPWSGPRSSPRTTAASARRACASPGRRRRSEATGSSGPGARPGGAGALPELDRRQLLGGDGSRSRQAGSHPLVGHRATLTGPAARTSDRCRPAPPVGGRRATTASRSPPRSSLHPQEVLPDDVLVVELARPSTSGVAAKPASYASTATRACPRRAASTWWCSTPGVRRRRGCRRAASRASRRRGCVVWSSSVNRSAVGRSRSLGSGRGTGLPHDDTW